jgi:hypothetical protein
MSQTFDSVNLVTLIEANAVLTRQLEAKQRRIEHLEYILEQRLRETKRQFNPELIDEMKSKVYRIFLANVGRGFTYEEAESEFEAMFGFHSANVGQRIRDLRQERKLWSDDKDGKVRFFLKLVEKVGDAQK